MNFYQEVGMDVCFCVTIIRREKLGWALFLLIPYCCKPLFLYRVPFLPSSIPCPKLQKRESLDRVEVEKKRVFFFP